MTVFELEKHFDLNVSRSLSCEWDNDGLMLCADSEKEVKSVLLTLDITQDAVLKAIDLGVDAIFTHHPFIFKSMKAICDRQERTKLILKLIKHNIAVFSYHTRLDAISGGVNDILANIIGLKNIQVLGEGELALGRIGDIESCSIDDFARNIKSTLSAPCVCISKSKKTPKIISRVALLGGACDREYVYEAINQGADVFVTGDVSYNLILDANLDGISMISVGHYASENPVLAFFENELRKFGIECTRFDCDYFTYI